MVNKKPRLISKKTQPCCTPENPSQTGSASGCCSTVSCCSPASTNGTPDLATTNVTTEAVIERTLLIDFLYLDLTVCTRCQGTDTTLDDALADLAPVLNAIGIAVKVNKVNVTTEDLAIQYQFVSSPTIRIDGVDIAPIEENTCDSCGDLCGTSVECRVWTYQGKSYSQPPKGLIIEAILRALYVAPANQAQSIELYTVPANLQQFYQAMANKNPCC